MLSVFVRSRPSASVLIRKIPGAFIASVGTHEVRDRSATIAARRAGAEFFGCAERHIAVEPEGRTLRVYSTSKATGAA